MTKYFTWSSAGTTEILAAPGAMKRYRILSAPMSANEETDSAILFEGGQSPINGSANVIEFVDNVRHSSEAFTAPYLTQKNIPVKIVTADLDSGTTSGKGMIIYLEETA